MPKSTTQVLIRYGYSRFRMRSFFGWAFAECLGVAFDGFLYLPAVGSRGGILLAWQSEYVTVTNPHMTTNALTASISIGGDQAWWFTGVYGPQGVGAKHAFLQELRDIRDLHAGPWMVAGDFNLIIDPEDKN